MSLCVKCKKLYAISKTGIVITLGNNACRSGDLYTCPGCGHQIILDLGLAYRDPLMAANCALVFDPETMQKPDRTVRLNAMEGACALETVFDAGVVDPGSELDVALRKGLSALNFLTEDLV